MSQLFKIEAIEEIKNITFEQKPYKNLSNEIEISVWPEFIDSKITSVGEIFIWSYQVRIENKNNFAVKLLSRYWRIINENGELQEIKGEGVIGEQPIISPQNSFQYTSGTHLCCPSGIMSGSYQMKNMENEELFDVTIPAFSLDVNLSRLVLN